MKLQTKIVVSLLALVVGAITLLGVLFSLQVKDFLAQNADSHLKARLDLVGGLFTRRMLSVDDIRTIDEELREIARDLEVRVTLIAQDGRVLFDSEVAADSVAAMENHGMRPEVQRARPHSIGIDRRRSASRGVDFIYAARMVAGDSLGELDSGYVRVAFPLYQLHEVDTRIQTIGIGVGIVTALIIGLISIQLTRRLFNPLNNIVETARAITRGEVSRRVAIHASRNEIGELARSVNDMAEKLAADITRLQKLERVRSEFLANVSHELRTPIFSMQGFLETLLDGAIDDPNVNRDFLEKAHRHAERLNTLLSDLIEISRIESGEMKMSFRYFPVSEFLRQVVEEMRPAAEKKNLNLRYVPDDDGPLMVFGDRGRLKQVLVNLIDNSIKYTDDGGSITCRTERSDGNCRISVEDTGCGIAEEHLTRIFERFYRVDRDRSREVGGTGLGLAIAKHIVEAHGSSIGVSSRVGQGSTFSFLLKT